jgi:transposase
LEISDDISVLKDLVIRLLTRIEDLERENFSLKSENIELKARLNQNSNNSHKPPSTDGLKKKPAFSQSKGKKTGGQTGHLGKTLQMVSSPDYIEIHHAQYCPCCHKTFRALDVEQIIQKRQVFDIPLPKTQVTEHQIGIISCCGQIHKGTFPDLVTQPVQYGSRIKAMSVLLNVDYKIPFDKIEQLFSDLYGSSFNESTAIRANSTCFDSLATTEEEIKINILDSPVAHFDETGMRVAGKLHWFHTASTTLFTYLFVHAKRGKEALESSCCLLNDFKNWAIHDCWKSYFGISTCSHGLCNAHILRELEALKENGSLWATEMQQFLLELFHLRQKATTIAPNKDIWLEKYQQICQMADEQEPPPTKGKKGKPKNSKGRNLLNRLVEHQEGVLAFAFIEIVPFTNNQAERDIRSLKTKQKVATSFRTFKGAQNHARIQSFVSTVRKHKMNVFENLINIFNHKKIAFYNA